MINRSVLIILFFSLILGACTSMRMRSQADIPVDHINIQHRKNVANNLFKQHDYHESLIQWKILQAIQPDNPEYKNRIRVLNALIKRRLKVHLADAQAAYKKQQYKKAEVEFLKVLALNPSHKIAISRLKTLTAKRIEDIQARKTQKLLAKRKATHVTTIENYDDPESDDVIERNNDDKQDEQALFYRELGFELFNKKDWRGSIRELNKYLPTNPSDNQTIKHLTTAHVNLSKVFEDRGHLEPAIQHIEDVIALSNYNRSFYQPKLKHLKQKLSANYYIEGIKVYRDNIDQAISYWQRAIETNPENEKARLRLKKAEKMKNKLKKIKPEQ